MSVRGGKADLNPSADTSESDPMYRPAACRKSFRRSDVSVILPQTSAGVWDFSALAEGSLARSGLSEGASRYSGPAGSLGRVFHYAPLVNERQGLFFLKAQARRGLRPQPF